ncbi:MAG: YHYH protein [Flavobacteriaceae bacterium]|nr:YHYH protein [Flavobacteriaceae bacterium]
MKIFKTIILMIVVLSVQTLIGHDAHYEIKTPHQWTLKNGTAFSGNFYLAKGKNVMLETAHGIKTIVQSELCESDQQFVADKLEWIKKINAMENIQQKKIESAGVKANGNGKTPIVNVVSYEALEKTKNKNYLIVIGIMVFLAFALKKIAALKPLKFAIPILVSAILITLTSFTVSKAKRWMGSTRVSFIDSAFSYYKPAISTRNDSKYYYVESLGLPDHETMLGITGWQQQVPIPQCYVGSNAWSIPLNPVVAATPVPVNQNHFLRGAVALAVNGIAIFNPYTNTGVDAFLDGQLDQYGGHCGRADDYHYHIAPNILYNKVPLTSPVAFALDGFAIYGSKEPDGSAMKSLDANHGHYGSDGVYHYHSSNSAPYMIGNMVGNVTEDATLQIIPQAAAKGVRPALTPLKGATITHNHPYPNGMGFKLTYTLGAEKDTVDYSWTANGDYTFKFITPAGTTTSNYKGQALCKPTVGNKNISAVNSPYRITVSQDRQISLLPISATNATNIMESAVYNINGAKVYHHNATPSINAENWAPGTYFYKAKMDDGNILTLKFILP